MDLRALKDRADTLFARGRFTDCAQVYRKILQHEPLDPRLHLRLAESLRRGPKPEEAVGCYRAAAAILTRSGHLAKARATLKVALELAPAHPVLLLALDTLDERLQPGGTPLESSNANLRRISEHEIAVRTPGAGWMVLYSSAPIQARHLGPSGTVPPSKEELMSEEVFHRVHGNR